MAKGKFIVGPGARAFPNYSDQELKYANKGFVLEFFHVPSGKVVQFKAMLTRFEDKYESSWKQDQVYGRNDPIQNFQGTKRVIGISWDLVAASWGEAKDNLQRATLLNSMLYPSYSDGSCNASTITAAPIFKLSFANLIRSYGNDSACKTDDTGFSKQDVEVQKAINDTAPFESLPQSKPQSISRTVPVQTEQKIGKAAPGGIAAVSGLVGTINGFTYAPVLENGFFDPKEDLGKLYPQTIQLSCEYTVMHTHKLGWAGEKHRNSNFPYGSPTTDLGGGIDANKQVMRDAKRNAGTRQQRIASQARILGAVSKAEADIAGARSLRKRQARKN